MKEKAPPLVALVALILGVFCAVFVACEDGTTPNCADAAAGCFPDVDGSADGAVDSGDATIDTGTDTGTDAGTEDASDAADDGDGA